jgi:CRISPR system Cascade subunit CasD
MAIRVDKAGKMMVDYQTINPPETTAYTWLSVADRKKLQHTVPTGSGGVWRVPSGVPPMETRRTYVADAVFSWFIGGENDQISRLRQALEEPHWQMSLGRKACVPEWPLFLGITSLSMLEAAEEVPVVGVKGSRKVHILAGVKPSGAQMIVCADNPLGSHPHDGYGLRDRHITDISPPIVATRWELLAWAKENLR